MVMGFPRSLSSLPLISAILIIFISISAAEASIHVYDAEIFKEVGNAYLLSGGSEGIVASRAVPPVSAEHHLRLDIHDGLSYIRFENVSFWRSKEVDKQSNMEPSMGLVQAIIFEAADRDNIGGSAYGGQRSICCTPDLAKLESCKQGEVIRRPSARDLDWPIVLNTQFSANHSSTNMESNEIYITKSGMYNLFFISCDPNLKGLVMSGKTLWKNPDGYLPGRMAPLMTFYQFMSAAYLVLTVIWISQYVRFWKDVLQLQNCISIIIVLGLLEMTLWYFEYLNFNNTGIRPIGITTWVVTIGAIRKTISRVLILSVSMGYGVVRPTLGGLTSKVLLLGVTYFLATELLDITEYVGSINDTSAKARHLLVLPSAVLDAFLILWIFTSLSKTLEQLQAKRSAAKLDIYRKFSNALAVAVIASVSWIAYEVYFKATDPFSEWWQSAWIITAFWDVLAFALLCVICYLWGPSQSSQRLWFLITQLRILYTILQLNAPKSTLTSFNLSLMNESMKVGYAYSQEAGEEFDDEEAQSLTRGTPPSNLSLVKLEKNERNVVVGDSIDPEGDAMEDKKE